MFEKVRIENNSTSRYFGIIVQQDANHIDISDLVVIRGLVQMFFPGKVLPFEVRDMMCQQILSKLSRFYQVTPRYLVDKILRQD